MEQNRPPRSEREGAMLAEGVLIAPQFMTARAVTARRMPQSPMDEARLEAFYRKTPGKRWSNFYRMTGNAGAAADLLQNPLLMFLQSNPPIADEDLPRRYVYKT